MAQKTLKRILFSIALCFFALPVSAIRSFAPNAILIDASTGTVLYEKDPDEAVQPASVSKLMTLYIMFEELEKGRFSLDDRFKVSKVAAAQTGTKMFVELGTQVAIRDLIRGVAIHSGNDAATVIAEGISGSVEAFAERMTQTAKRIGMKNSSFGNPSGRFHEKQQMSMRDIAMLSFRLMKDFPEHYKIFSERSFTYNKVTQKNRNPLLAAEIGADGLKTGFIPESGYMLAASATQGDRRLILAAGGYNTSKDRAKDTLNLMRAGFSEFIPSQYLARKGVKVVDVKVAVGEFDHVEAVVAENLRMTLPTEIWSKIKAYAAYEEPVIAPVRSGQKIGQLHLRIPNRPEIIIPLVAKNDVNEKNMISKAQDNWATWFESMTPEHLR